MLQLRIGSADLFYLVNQCQSMQDSVVTETEDKLSASVKKLQGKKKDLTEAEFKLNY